MVLAFSQESLFKALAAAPCTEHDISLSQVAKYLVSYLSALSVATIVVEYGYVDADYLDDYANFYAKSFDRIPNRCRRLHFFTSKFGRARFLRFVNGQSSSAILQKAYAGFVVARPLPTASIGRSVLATYPSDGARRNYTTVKRYCVSLFGMQLSLDSLAFQEQDTSLAACAPVALWSCFQKTQDLFQSHSPTPVAITRAANQFFLATRPFPSRGLQVQQICNAIAAVGLDPEVYPVTASVPLASLVYSYLKLGLPVLLLVDVPGMGGHAIAITGYSLRQTEQLTSEGGQVGTLLPKLVGLRIDEFYGHDDQQGPFRRLKLESPTAPDSTIEFSDTGWSQRLVPEVVIVPVYPKIRTGFREVQKILPILSSVAGWAADPTKFEWDVFLTSGNDFKASVRSDALYTAHALKETLLLDGFPRYIWRCILRLDGIPLMEALLDTTAMVAGFPIRHLLWHNETVRAQVGPFTTNPALKPQLVGFLGPRLFEALVTACRA